MTLLAFGQIGFWQILIVLFVVLLLFGGKKLPGLARSLGQSLTEFKRGLKEEPDDDEKKLDDSDGSGPSGPEA
ncbi:MAG: twin-arginine translocase TatA/TatE family subunit [Planctomycetota bacterium]|nr:twin-arginine translocase TatA/TatE family subunit [Planctomycetota bacterium]